MTGNSGDGIDDGIDLDDEDVVVADTEVVFPGQSYVAWLSSVYTMLTCFISVPLPLQSRIREKGRLVIRVSFTKIHPKSSLNFLIFREFYRYLFTLILNLYIEDAP